MWNRRELKKEARRTLRRNYLRAVFICALMAVIVGAYSHPFSRNNVGSIAFSRSGYQTNYEIVDNLISGLIQENMGSYMPDILPGQEETAPDEGWPGEPPTRGVLAAVINNTTRTGSFLFGIINAVNQLVFGDRVLPGVIIMLAAAVSFLYWMFVGNVLRIGECRFFLENRIYPQTGAVRWLYLFSIRRIVHPAVIQASRILFTILWGFTIVGGVYKAYGYRMIPYIVAENPDIRRKEAFFLSQEMMRGNRWKLFLMDISFLPLSVLNILTIGVSGLFYSNPYRASAYAGVYICLRQKAVDENWPYTNALNDFYLTKPPEDGALEYPKEHFSIPESQRRLWIATDYHRRYTVNSLVLLFIGYSMIGWIWEVLLGLAAGGQFVNRGMMHGPWLPIYGTGGVLVMIALKKWIDKPWLVFVLASLMCGTIEYVTASVMQNMMGESWWSYDGYFLNLDGKVCVEGIILFGLGCCVSIYFLAPVLDRLFNKIPARIQRVICIVLAVLFLVDYIFSLFYPNKGPGVADPVNSPPFR